MKNLLIVQCLLGISLVSAVPVDQGGSQFADDDSNEGTSSFEEWFYRRPIGWNPFFRNQPAIDYMNYGDDIPELNLMIIITDFENPDSEDESYECDETYAYSNEKDDENSNQQGGGVPLFPQAINWNNEPGFVQAPEPPIKSDYEHASLNQEIVKTEEPLSTPPNPPRYDQTAVFHYSGNDDRSSGNYKPSENIDKPLVNDAYQPPSDQQHRESGRTLSQADDDFDDWLFNDSDDSQSDNGDSVSDGDSVYDFDNDSDDDSNDNSDDNSDNDSNDNSHNDSHDDSNYDYDYDSDHDSDDSFYDYLTDDSDSDDDYSSSGDYNSDDTESQSFNLRSPW